MDLWIHQDQGIGPHSPPPQIMDLIHNVLFKYGQVFGEASGTTNPGGTRKPDNPLNVIQNPIPQDPDNPLKGIRYLVQNRTRSHWPRGLTIPT